MKFFAAYRKKRAIQKIAKKLPGYLRRSYGGRRKYSPGQVRTAVGNTGCNIILVCYGYAMFCSPEDFDLVHEEMGEQCDYDYMHQEVADICFSGNTNFEMPDFSSYSSDSGSGFDGGGFDGSSGGGD